jgi:hypothetical protein
MAGLLEKLFIVSSSVHDTDQSQTPGSLGRLPSSGEEIGKILILIEGSQVNTRVYVGVALGGDCVGYTGRFFRDWRDGLWVERHLTPPRCADRFSLQYLTLLSLPSPAQFAYTILVGLYQLLPAIPGQSHLNFQASCRAHVYGRASYQN